MKRLTLVLFLYCCSNIVEAQKKQYSDLIQPSIFALTRVMMHDVVNPPAASRFYAYSMVAASEAISGSDTNVTAMLGLLKDHKPVANSVYAKIKNPEITCLFAILETGKIMLPSGYMIEKDLDELSVKLRKLKVPDIIINEAKTAAVEIAGNIARYASQDDYNKLSAKLRYTPRKGEGYWYPTPPSYLEAVEPNWKTIRPFLIDSCNQFMPAPPVAYSGDSASEFHMLANEVYAVSRKLSAEQLHIAGFWDCNPFAVDNAGHLAIGFKKISPGGHWMNITSIAARSAKLSFNQAIIMHSLVSFVLMDAFISCWDEKYRSHRIRPETFINRNINIKWQPLLQTPPFPEYPSGHSVISGAAAEVLSYFLGDNFAYTDDSELMFEIAPRRFSSFRQAAGEAAISRLYGGIHFRDAIINGQTEGKNVGEFIVEKVKNAGLKPFLR
jgi:hypothetical protein